MANAQVREFIDSTIKKVWLEDISEDHYNLYLLKEDTLKNAFYYHLRRRIGDHFLSANNLCIFTEYKIGNQRIDLVVVEIDLEKVKNNYLGNCVKEVLAVIEMKYKGKYASEACFDKDVLKVLNYINQMNDETLFYLAFIREMDFNPDEVTYFLPDLYKSEAKGKITELLSYGIKDENQMIWEVIEH